MNIIAPAVDNFSNIPLPAYTAPPLPTTAPPTAPPPPPPPAPSTAKAPLQTNAPRRPAPVKYRKRFPSIPTQVMVTAAIRSQSKAPRNDVSFVAIKKYITRNYEGSVVDVNARLRYVKRYIKHALESGTLVRTRGVGVCGSFRLPVQKNSNTKAPVTRRQVASKVTKEDTKKRARNLNRKLVK